MFRTLFLLFIILPIIEIMVLMEVGAIFGFWTTLAIVVLTAWLGAKLVREQGVSTLNNIQTKLSQGKLPPDDIIAGLMILVSGVLMLTPGFITDFLGLFLLWPKGRAALAKVVKEKVLATQLRAGSAQFHYSSFQEQQFRGNVYEHEQSNEAQADGVQAEQQPKVLEGDFQRKE